MASRTFTMSVPAMAGASTFRLPVLPQGALTVLVNGSPAAFTQPTPTTVILTTPLADAGTVSFACIAYAVAAKATAPGTPINALTVSTGGSVGDVLGAQSVLSSLTDSSGGTAGTTIAAISDTATKNAIASIVAKLTQVQQQCNAMRNSITCLGSKDNEVIAALKAAGIAT